MSLPGLQSIEDARNDAYVSRASLWEIAVKMSIGKLDLDRPFEQIFPAQLALNGITLLDISIDHLAIVATLPLHHRDPFDRVLVAQARMHQMTIISADPALDAYGISRLW